MKIKYISMMTLIGLLNPAILMATEPFATTPLEPEAVEGALGPVALSLYAVNKVDFYQVEGADLFLAGAPFVYYPPKITGDQDRYKLAVEFLASIRATSASAVEEYKQLLAELPEQPDSGPSIELFPVPLCTTTTVKLPYTGTSMLERHSLPPKKGESECPQGSRYCPWFQEPNESAAELVSGFDAGDQPTLTPLYASDYEYKECDRATYFSRAGMSTLPTCSLLLTDKRQMDAKFAMIHQSFVSACELNVSYDLKDFVNRWHELYEEVSAMPVAVYSQEIGVFPTASMDEKLFLLKASGLSIEWGMVEAMSASLIHDVASDFTKIYGAPKISQSSDSDEVYKLTVPITVTGMLSFKVDQMSGGYAIRRLPITGFMELENEFGSLSLSRVDFNLCFGMEAKIDDVSKLRPRTC